MALEEIFSGSPPSGKGLTDVLQELQGLKFAVVAGAAADTNIAVAGITTSDTIRAVVRFHGAGTDVTDVSLVTDAAITSAGNIQVDTTVTTGSKLLVIWSDKSGA